MGLDDKSKVSVDIIVAKNARSIASQLHEQNKEQSVCFKEVSTDLVSDLANLSMDDITSAAVSEIKACSIYQALNIDAPIEPIISEPGKEVPAMVVCPYTMICPNEE
tara:strand:- start:479 stop:799 length:321 start_codon:yes stop_codon:yes gene_type:complete